MQKKHIYWSDIHGYSRLAIEATLGVTDLVEAMHRNILALPMPLAKAAATPDSGVHGAAYQLLHRSSAIVYDTIRGVTKLVSGGLDAAMEHLQSELGHLDSSDERAALISILNGVLGDHMTAHDNPLTITMGFYQDGKLLELTPTSLTKSIPAPQGRILVLLHGHCMNELQWQRNGHDHGKVLAAANGFTPIYLRYNTGLHISKNGRACADLLEELIGAWPVPIEEICIMGYSMGGLVARSAFHYGALNHCSWLGKVQKLMFVGTPHHGSMVERAGNMVDLALDLSPYSQALSRLGKIRSAGTTDLRHGNLIDEDWEGHDRFAHAADQRTYSQLPANVRCYAIAAALAKEQNALQDQWIGDGLVPVNSALGRHKDERRALRFADEHSRVFYGLSHLGLLDSQDVCVQLQIWMCERN